MPTSPPGAACEPGGVSLLLLLLLSTVAPGPRCRRRLIIWSHSGAMILLDINNRIVEDILRLKLSELE